MLRSRDPSILFVFTRKLDLIKQVSLEGDGLGITHDIATQELYICDYKGSDIKVLSSNDKGKLLRSFSDISSSRLSGVSVC